MAITWDTQITKVNNPRIDVTFTRSDSDKPNDDFTVSFKNRMASSPSERLVILNDAWAAWQAEILERSNLATFLDSLEDAANANLLAREV